MLASSFSTWNLPETSLQRNLVVFLRAHPSSILSARDRLSSLIDKKNMHAHGITLPYGVTCVASLHAREKGGT